MTKEERVVGVSGMELLKVINARRDITNDTLWPKDLEFSSRTQAVLITELSGRVRLVNMTGADVQEVDQQYIDNVVDVIRYILFRHDLMTEYFQSRPDSEKMSVWERWRLSLDATAIPPPSGSWFYDVDEIILLNDGWEVDLLHQAAEKAGVSVQWDICVRSSEISGKE